MVGGIAILVFVGISYERAQHTSAKSPSWSAAQRHQARLLAHRLSGHQQIAVPTRQTAKVPAGKELAIRIVIPKITVDSRVVETPAQNGIWPVADWAVGHLTSSPNPGAPGNDALSAHDDIKGEIFKRLGELGPGDEILVYTRHAVFTYVVTNQLTVDPSDVAVLNPTRSPTVTLITCTPYWVDSQRLVVQGLLKKQAAA
jgi:sortase A